MDERYARQIVIPEIGVEGQTKLRRRYDEYNTMRGHKIENQRTCCDGSKNL